jgi:hypothetical protein
VRGRLVGKNLGPLGFRWLRQSFSVSDATLTLHEYPSTEKIGDLKTVAVVKTDSHGHFDFGSIPKGHYVLAISVKDSDRMSDMFDVEVTDTVKPQEVSLSTCHRFTLIAPADTNSLRQRFNAQTH